MVLSVPLAAADDPNDEFIQGLLSRGLAQVAEHEALRRLDDPLLKPVDRVQWTIRLTKAYLEHARQVEGTDRCELADRAQQTLLALQQNPAQWPRAEAVQVQLALLQAIRAAWPLSGSTMSGPDPLPEAIAGLRTTLGGLDEAARRAARRTAQELAAGELSIGAVRRLQREVEQQLAASLVALIERTAAGPEQNELISEADRRLQTLADGWIGDLGTWEARLLRVRLARLRGDTDRALSLVQGALGDDPALWLADRFLAEQVRAQSAAGRYDAALQALLDRQRSHGALSDELIAVQVEAWLAARRLAEQRGDRATADALWLQAEAAAASLSGAWGASARAQLETEKDAARYGEGVARLVQSARRAYQADDADGALRLFEQASAQALAAGQGLAAEELDYTRSSILIARGRFAEAADILSRMLAQAPFGPHARDGDLLRAYALGRLYSAEPTPPREAAYAAALAAHRTQYPETTSAAEATWMLAALEESRQQWTAALSLYLALVDDMTHGPGAQLRVAVLYEQILSLLRSQRQPVEEWEDRAVEDVAAFVRRYPRAPGELTAAQADVALKLVRMIIQHREHLYTEADRFLAVVLQAGEQQRRLAEQEGRPLPGEWAGVLRSAAQWRLISLAGQGRMEEAQRAFHDLAATDVGALLSLLDGLTALATVIPQEHRQELAHLQLAAAQQLRLQQPALTEAQQLSLDAAIADAYLASGNVLNALGFFERLVEKAPHDLARLRTAAELTLRVGDVPHLQRAKAYWQRVERLEPKGSPGWLQARLKIADCAARLKQPDEARKLIALTRLVYPELGGTELRGQFEALEKSLR